MNGRDTMSLWDADPEPKSKILVGTGEVEDFAAELERVGPSLSRRVNTDAEEVERGLAKLVLTLVEFLRQLLEKQALRRVEAGSLNDEEIERLGQTLMKLEARMQTLKKEFGLEEEDLNLSLGPLGNLL